MTAQRPPVFLPGQYITFRPDHKSFGEFILSDQVRDVVAEVSGDIAALARSLTQTGSAKNHEEGTPHMRDRYKVVKQAGDIRVGKDFPNLRVLTHVENDDPAAAAEEFGGKYNKRNRMLARAGAAFGDFKGKGKP